MADNKLKYLSARIGEQWYGIDVDRIIEVLHLVAFTEVPTAREDILGLITVRDEVMPLIDLRRCFGQQEVAFSLDTPIVAIREHDGPIALLFDDADRVEHIDEAEITVSKFGQPLPYVRAVAKLPEKMLFVLDTGLISRSVQSATALG